MEVVVIDKRTPNELRYSFQTDDIGNIGARNAARIDNMLGDAMFEAAFKCGIGKDFQVTVYSDINTMLKASNGAEYHMFDIAGPEPMTPDQLASRAYHLMRQDNCVGLVYDLMIGRWYLSSF